MDFPVRIGAVARDCSLISIYDNSTLILKLRYEYCGVMLQNTASCTYEPMPDWS